MDPMGLPWSMNVSRTERVNDSTRYVGTMASHGRSIHRDSAELSGCWKRAAGGKPSRCARILKVWQENDVFIASQSESNLCGKKLKTKAKKSRWRPLQTPKTGLEDVFYPIGYGGFQGWMLPARMRPSWGGNWWTSRDSFACDIYGFEDVSWPGWPLIGSSCLEAWFF